MESKKIKTCIALGNFDGIHIGHDILIKKMLEIGKKKKLSNLIVTFKYLDENMKKSISNLKCITNYDNKLRILREYDADKVETIVLDSIVSKYSPEKFINDILVKEYNVSMIVIGYNFRFGYKAKGNINTLNKYKFKYKYDVEEIRPVCFNELPVSSSLIRELITKGKIKKANELLVNNYFIDCNDITFNNNNNTGIIFNNKGIITPKEGFYEIKIGDKIKKIFIEKNHMQTVIKFDNENDMKKLFEKIEFIKKI